MDRDYAEDVNYWKSGTAAPDSWIDKAKRDIRSVGGQIIGDMTVNDESTGRAAFCLAFVLQGDKYQIKWPVLESKTGNLQAARRQAATALYHDVKARCVELNYVVALPECKRLPCRGQLGLFEIPELASDYAKAELGGEMTR